MRNTIPTRTVTLDPNEVIVPLAKQLEECRNSVLFGLQTMELVHRGGLVSDRDFTDQTEKALKLEWVRLKVSFIKDGKEIEIHGTGEIDGGIPHKLNIKLEDDSIRFKQGEIITFNYRQFKEFILTCSQFGKDLVDCLPKKFST